MFGKPGVLFVHMYITELILKSKYFNQNDTKFIMLSPSFLPLLHSYNRKDILFPWQVQFIKKDILFPWQVQFIKKFFNNRTNL